MCQILFALPDPTSPSASELCVLHQAASLSCDCQLGFDRGTLAAVWGAPTGTGRWGYACLLFLSCQVASGWPCPFTKLAFSTQGPLFSERCSRFSLLSPGVIIALSLLNQVTVLPFANRPFVNKPSWNYPHLQVPSVSYWDCG